MEIANDLTSSKFVQQVDKSKGLSLHCPGHPSHKIGSEKFGEQTDPDISSAMQRFTFPTQDEGRCDVEGEEVGRAVGSAVGFFVGSDVGRLVGRGVGLLLGAIDGTDVRHDTFGASSFTKSLSSLKLLM